MTLVEELKSQEKDLRPQIDEYLINREYQQAEKLLVELLRTEGDDPVLINALGTARAGLDDLAGAEKAFKLALIIDPEYSDAYYNLGLAYCRFSRPDDALEAYLAAVRINPLDASAQNDLGVLYYSQGKTLLAKGHFIKALEANPLFKNALLNLVDICWESGAYAEALSWIKRVLDHADKDLKRSLETEELEESLTRHAIDPTNVPSPSKAPDKTRLKKTGSKEIDEIFLKHVPAELRDKKIGMNIAVVADYNIAGQLSLLFRYINQYTIHKARMIILQGDYLSYDHDLILSAGKRDDYFEARNIVRNADFYHIGRFPVNFGEIEWNQILKPDNSIVQYYGSEIRWNAEPIYKWHQANKIHGISCWDYTMIEHAPLFYHVNIMCDLDRVKTCQEPKDIVRICHPPTNRAFKKTELFLSVIEKLKKKYPLELELIEKKTNEECLEIKSRCHITYDQISVGIYGLSAIESMAAGHTVLCGISNFAASYHPDNPIVYVNEDNLYDKIEYLLNNKNEIVKTGHAGREWAYRHHNPHNIVRQICWLYDLARNGHRLVDERDIFMLK
jgi:tetratricopeptide (TPR) repeat protein